MKRTRRGFLRLGGLAAIGSLAGCALGSPAAGGRPDTPTPTPTATATATPSPTPTPTATPTATEIDYGDWFADTSNFDGTTVDARGQGEVTVTVGARGNAGAFAFDPAAVRVDPGTSVVWEWSGNGGAHNVVALDGSFSSGDPAAGADITFERTFENEGLYKYYCNPHRGLGMKGAVVVGTPATGGDNGG